ncbi:MAG: PP2C family protein-serine/threonine phosphatase [Nitrososphaerota archaeon]
MARVVENKDNLLLIGFLLGAGLLLLLGRSLIKDQVMVTWGLTFSGTTAVVILLASLYRVQLELRASQHELARKEAEINFALEVQQALFPRYLPANSSLDFTAICIPARGVSGDYYDVIQFSQGRLVFAIADVSGKGISAAILVSNLQAVFRLLAESGAPPEEICARINTHLHQVTDSSKFATFFYAEWDETTHLLRYVNAGHHAPLLIGRERKCRLEKGGMPLGILPNAKFQAGEVQLYPGDLIVLFSDGIIEANSTEGEEFGEARLETLVRECLDLPVGEIQDRILKAIAEWGSVEDDMTLLIARVKE